MKRTLVRRPHVWSRRVFAALALAGTVFAHAQEPGGTIEKIRESNRITVGYRESSIPFSYLDDQQKPIGYTIDICMRVIEKLKTELKLPNLETQLNPVTSATRIPLMANGTVDLECGSTTNNLERQKQVAFAPTTFVAATRLVAKKSANIKSLNDLKGKTLVSTAGTTNLKLLTQLNAQRDLGMNILPAKDHAEAFLMVETGRAQAFGMDDGILLGIVANAKNPADYVITSEALSVEPYGIMLRRDDPAFKKLIDNAVISLFKSGEINKIYAKWFESPIPPKNVNLGLSMADALKKVIANPTDSGDPAAY